MANLVLTCKDCGVTFDVSEGEQSWYAKKGWEVPKRCKNCRQVKKNERKQKEFKGEK